MGFARSWVMIVINCLKTVRYSMLINGVPTGYITPTCGIRQGVPLSPYLFILEAEGLSALFTKMVDQGAIKGLHVTPTAPKVHHLFFVDHSLLFGEASEAKCQIFKDLRNVYEQASGH